MCFNEWPLDAEQYNTIQFKHWFKNTSEILGDQNILFAFWCSENRDRVENFVENFISTFNALAEKMEVDTLPFTPMSNEEPNQNTEI